MYIIRMSNTTIYVTHSKEIHLQIKYTDTLTHTHAYTHTHTHTHTHTLIHTLIHTHSHKHSHTHSHTYTLKEGLIPLLELY